MQRSDPAGNGSSPAPADAAGEDGLTFAEILARRNPKPAVLEGATPAAQQQVDYFLTNTVTGDMPAGGGEIWSSDTDDEPEREQKARITKPRLGGQGMLEYALILVLVAVVVIVLLGTVGHQAQDIFSNVSRGLGN